MLGVSLKPNDILVISDTYWAVQYKDMEMYYESASDRHLNLSRCIMQTSSGITLLAKNDVACNVSLENKDL